VSLESDDTELQIVGTFATRIEAELAQSALQSAGITGIVSADDAGGNRPDLGRRGIRLLVRAADASDAAAILRGDRQ
jgi:hypothetical protein